MLHFSESGDGKMDDLTKLKTAVSLIVVGLYEKERKKKDGEYYYSRKLIHGINIFQSLNYKYNPKGFDFDKMHEQCFITEYAMQPVSQWFAGWENAAEKLDLENQGFYHLGALVGDSGFHTFHVNDDCEDYIEYVEKDIIAGIEQRAVYDCLKELSQDEYVNLRKYIIEHSQISFEELRKLKLIFSQNDMALQAIENAYEEIMDDCYVQGELTCIRGEAGILRLKRGVMKYISEPGQLELEIYNYCMKHKVQSVLWPEMDKYDIEITFPNGDVWAIDAKAIKEPYFLKENIIRDGGFPDGNYKKGLYVIPDAYADARTDYLDIINRQLKSMGNTNIQCIRLRDLKKEIRERGGHK